MDVCWLIWGTENLDVFVEIGVRWNEEVSHCILRGVGKWLMFNIYLLGVKKISSYIFFFSFKAGSALSIFFLLWVFVLFLHLSCLVNIIYNKIMLRNCYFMVPFTETALPLPFWVFHVDHSNFVNSDKNVITYNVTNFCAIAYRAWHEIQRGHFCKFNFVISVLEHFRF